MGKPNTNDQTTIGGITALEYLLNSAVVSSTDLTGADRMAVIRSVLCDHKDQILHLKRFMTIQRLINIGDVPKDKCLVFTPRSVVMYYDSKLHPAVRCLSFRVRESRSPDGEEPRRFSAGDLLLTEDLDWLFLRSVFGEDRHPQGGPSFHRAETITLQRVNEAQLERLFTDSADLLRTILQTLLAALMESIDQREKYLREMRGSAASITNILEKLSR